MASMSSINAAIAAEGGQDQELPPSVDTVPAAAAAGGVAANRPNGVRHFPHITPALWDVIGPGPHPWDGFFFDHPFNEEDDVQFPTDPVEYEALMMNLAFLVEAMRKVGAFVEEDDYGNGQGGGDGMDCVVPDVHRGFPGPGRNFPATGHGFNLPGFGQNFPGFNFPGGPGLFLPGHGLDLPSTGLNLPALPRNLLAMMPGMAGLQFPEQGAGNLGAIEGQDPQPGTSAGGMKKQGVAGKKKNVHFQYDPKYDETEEEEDINDQFVPEMDPNNGEQAVAMGEAEGQAPDQNQYGNGPVFQ